MPFPGQVQRGRSGVGHVSRESLFRTCFSQLAPRRAGLRRMTGLGCSFARPVSLDIDPDIIGRAALHRIKEEGVTCKQIGLIVEGAPLNGLNTSHWPIRKNGRRSIIGSEVKVRKATHHARRETRRAFALSVRKVCGLWIEPCRVSHGKRVTIPGVGREYPKWREEVAARRGVEPLFSG